MGWWRRGERWTPVFLLLLQACSRSEKPIVAEPPPSRSSPAPPPAPVEAVRPKQRETVDVGAGLPPGEAPEVAPKESWTKLPLSEGLTVELRTERPGAVLDKLGRTTLTISRGAERFAVNGLEAIFGDVSALATRALGHEETVAFGEEVAKAPSVVVFAVTLGTGAGEDIRRSFFQTAIWKVGLRPDGIVATRLWSGPGGEGHRFFEACLFGVEMSYELDASKRLVRHCKRIVERHPDASLHSDCATEPDMKCSEEIIGTLEPLSP